MPDSALPPPAAQESNGSATGMGNVPRMGTPQTDASWAGWAISSFTKTLGNVTGEIQPQTSTPGSENGSPGGLGGASAPVRPESSRSASASNLHRQAVGASSPPGGSSRNASTSLMMGGGMDNDDDSADLDAWGDMDDTPKPKISEENKRDAPAGGFGRTSGFGAAEEHDVINSFMTKPKTSLPKGLGKKATVGTAVKSKTAGSRPLIGKPVSTVTSKKVVAPVTKPKVEEADADAWGNNDNWDDEWK